jgi:hypothetical protein
MSTSKGQVRIELTPEQKAQIRKVIGKDAETLELSIEELEERIAPSTTPTESISFNFGKPPFTYGG